MNGSSGSLSRGKRHEGNSQWESRLMTPKSGPVPLMQADALLRMYID